MKFHPALTRIFYFISLVNDLFLCKVNAWVLSRKILLFDVVSEVIFILGDIYEKVGWHFVFNTLGSNQFC